MIAIFFDNEKMQVNTVNFGAAGYGYPNYTISPHDEERQQRYIKRHSEKENWKYYMTAGALSRYI